MNKDALDLGSFIGSTAGAAGGALGGTALARKLGLKGGKALAVEAAMGALGYNVGYEAFKKKMKKTAGLIPLQREFPKLKAIYVRGAEEGGVRRMSKHMLKGSRLASGLVKFNALFKGKKEIRGFLKDITEEAHRNHSVIGTSTRTKKGRRAVLDWDLVKQLPRQERREVYLHERMHGVPVLGSSELFAHIAGKVRAAKGIKEKAKAVPAAVKQLAQSDPVRFTAEVAGLGGISGATIGLVAMTKKGNEVSEEDASKLARKILRALKGPRAMVSSAGAHLLAEGVDKKAEDRIYPLSGMGESPNKQTGRWAKFVSENPQKAEKTIQTAVGKMTAEQRALRWAKMLKRGYEKSGRKRLAHGMTPSDIARKHKVPLPKLMKELRNGIKVEYEHGGTEEDARSIAMDHLVESPVYYTELKKMEEKLENPEPKPSKVPEARMVKFFRDNPNPSDKKLHAWAEKKGLNPHSVEEAIYRLATKHVRVHEKTGWDYDSRTTGDSPEKKLIPTGARSAVHRATFNRDKKTGLAVGGQRMK